MRWPALNLIMHYRYFSMPARKREIYISGKYIRRKIEIRKKRNGNPKYLYNFLKVLEQRKRQQELFYDFKLCHTQYIKNDTCGNQRRQIQAIKNTNTSKASTFLISKQKKTNDRQKKMSLCCSVAGRDPSVERLSGGLARRPRGRAMSRRRAEAINSPRGGRQLVRPLQYSGMFLT